MTTWPRNARERSEGIRSVSIPTLLRVCPIGKAGEIGEELNVRGLALERRASIVFCEKSDLRSRAGNGSGPPSWENPAPLAQSTLQVSKESIALLLSQSRPCVLVSECDTGRSVIRASTVDFAPPCQCGRHITVPLLLLLLAFDPNQSRNSAAALAVPDWIMHCCARSHARFTPL